MTTALQLDGHGPVLLSREVKFSELPDWLPQARYALVDEPVGSIHYPRSWLVPMSELLVQVSAA